MITPSFGLTATERVLPKLALDFTNANLDSRITFTRTTGASNPATYVNSSGYVTAATNNQPRFDYNPVTLACKGLLIEESRSNLLTYSNDFLDTATAGSTRPWVWVYVTVNPTGTTGPDGVTNSMSKIIESNTNASHTLRCDITGSVDQKYTISAFFKKDTRQYVRLGIQNLNITADFIRGQFDLTDGTTYNNGSNGSAVFDSAGVEDLGNGIYRCYVTGSVGSVSGSTTIRCSIQMTSTKATLTAGGAYQGDGTSGLYVWGAQIEAGAFATSYIPTTTTALTRNADVATMTGTNFSDWWTATNGASDIWLTPKSTSTLAYMSFDDNTANNKIIIANNTTSGQSTITSGGTLQATLTAGTITANATNKVGCSWNTNNCAATANATTPATTASATIPTVTQLRIGSNGTSYANAWIQKLFYWPQRITNNEIQAFTK